jgi:hypothetical protein
VLTSPPSIHELFAAVKTSHNPLVLEQLLEALHRLYLYADKVRCSLLMHIYVVGNAATELTQGAHQMEAVEVLRRASVDHVALLTPLLGDQHTKAVRFYAAKLIINASVDGTHASLRRHISD